MKRYILNKNKDRLKYANLVIAALALLLPACSDNILDKSPVDSYSDAVLWTDINLADAYLLDAYNGTGIGFAQRMPTTVSDETLYNFAHGPENYVQGNITADNTLPWANGRLPAWAEYYSTIQKLNVFIEKIDGLPEAYSESERPDIEARAGALKGEAIFLRAYCYTQLARTYGGVPLIKESFTVGDDFLSIPRASFEETVSFISQDCDAAAELLPPKAEAVMGKANKAAALALKSRILLFAASDLTADGTAANKFVGYESPDRTALWTAAKNAAKAVMDLGVFQLADFGAPDPAAVAQNYYDFFRQKDLTSNEVIWGKMYAKALGTENRMNLWNSSNGLNNWSGNGPTQDFVDAYQMEDGSDFYDHFNLDANNRYRNSSSTFTDENPYLNREPRFYGSILYDGALWQKRFPNLEGQDPVGVYDRRTRVTIRNGETVSTVFGIDTRQGPVESWNANLTGYLMKKMLDDQIIGKDENNDNAWIEFRYTEILLNYAEACLALGETGEAATFINRIRNRAGLPAFTGDIAAALRHERQIELAFESQRWYDIRRWKILEQVLTDAKGMNITETDEDGTVTTTWERVTVQTRRTDERMYWVPIPTDEINKAPQLTQNPGY